MYNLAGINYKFGERIWKKWNGQNERVKLKLEIILTVENSFKLKNKNNLLINQHWNYVPVIMIIIIVI